jgi:hypothetical protein
MVVGDHQFDTLEAACLERDEESFQAERLSRPAMSTARI